MVRYQRRIITECEARSKLRKDRPALSLSLRYQLWLPLLCRGFFDSIEPHRLVFFIPLSPRFVIFSLSLSWALQIALLFRFSRPRMIRVLFFFGFVADSLIFEIHQENKTKKKKISQRTEGEKSSSVTHAGEDRSVGGRALISEVP